MNDRGERSVRGAAVLAVALIVVLLGGACSAGRQGAGSSDVALTRGTVRAPDFPPGLEWLNVAEPLSLRGLRGKVVLLDFWTQGCINCIHVIPDLKRLEEEFGDALVVIGVHSAKFTREGNTDAIRQAVLRYGVEHPVVNDNGFAIWNEYAVRAWPTSVLIDPTGRIVSEHAGEGVHAHHHPRIAELVDQYGRAGRLDRDPIDVRSEAGAATSVLSFPGEVLADEAGGRLFISDSNHHRVLVADLDGALQASIGDGTPGLRDGPSAAARLNRPHGLALSPDGATLYVADLENHAVRAVDLARGVVRTVAGTGTQGFDNPVVSQPALETPLSSPWDVAVDGSLVHIAMSGQHQLWTLDPTANDGAGEVRVLAGSGREGLGDGEPGRATLAQPSGLALSRDRTLFFTDPEASAVRRVPLGSGGAASGDVATIIGLGLFEFGDRDGAADEALLQHALGIDWHDGLLYVADTYNHKLKIVDPDEGTVRTWVGSGGAGWHDGPGSRALFDEPGAVSIAGRRAYVADTNNHVIRVVDLTSGAVSTLPLSNLGIATLPSRPGGGPGAEEVALPAVEVAPGDGALELAFDLPAGYVLNELGPLTATVATADPAVASAAPSGFEGVAPAFPVRFPLHLAPGSTTLTVDVTVYYCRKEQQELCLVRSLRLAAPVTVTPAAITKVVPVRRPLPPLEELQRGVRA